MIEKWKQWCNQKLSQEGKARKIGVLVSGGADSAMALYVISKHILDCDKSKRFSKSIIVPMHGWDQRRINVYSPDSAKEVIKVVKKLLPEAPIKDLQICGYYKEKGEDLASDLHDTLSTFVLSVHRFCHYTRSGDDTRRTWADYILRLRVGNPRE